MAFYDGFFDAEYNAEADSYDREYESGDFTGYLAQVIGSGVCVYNNEDSFKVRMGDGAAIISPGYLFIQGYYLKNDADHSLTLPGTGTYAIAAHLSLGKRMIELEAVSVSSSYPDSLVLAIVNGTANTADDTRYNTDICGVIDSAGELSKKVEYAINYIDNEIEGKLASVQAEIDAQAAKMDAKIADAQAIVDRIVPPPVGTIKFTAAQNVGDEWIRCDGTFINQSDYPDLVEALGKLTPGVDSVTELLQANKSEQMSNACLVSGTVWVYLAESKKLVGVTGTTKKEIAVTGVDALEVNPAIDIVLSVVDGAVYLAQNNAGSNKFILLECATFTGSENVIEMTMLDTAGKRAASEDEEVKTGKYSLNCIPKVAKIGISVHMTFQISTLSSQRYIACFEWTPGAFDTTAEIQTIEYCYAYGTQRDDTYFPLFMFNAKNGNELVVLYYYYWRSSGSVQNFLEIFSETQGIYGSKESATQAPTAGSSQIKRNIAPVCGNGECLFDIWVEQRHPVIYFANYDLNAGMTTRTIDAVSLPSRSKVFKESVVYATAQGLWFVFVGTGLLFAENLEEGSWGFLDTQNLIGVIGAYGCLNYDSATNSLYISGMDTAGTPKVEKLKLPDLYNYATDGAFLPSLASDGVPAYIKAENNGGTPGGTTTISVKVLPPTSATNLSFESLAQVQFNGVAMAQGEYTRTIGETFTVGIKRLGTAGTSSTCYAVVKVNGTGIASVPIKNGTTGDDTQTVTLYTADYASTGITLQGATQYAS